MLAHLAVLVLSVAYPRQAAAQEPARTVTGTVLDTDGIPMPGTAVIVSGGRSGVVTDTDGKFSVRVRPSDTLQFQFLGFKTITLPVGSRMTFNITMEQEEATSLDEVVVIGYGQVAKKDLTGSVSTVKMSDIEGTPVLSYMT